MPRVEVFDKEQVLGRALNLFWKNGYEATSLADLTTELEIGKGSLYNSFGSKRQLFDQCLEMYRSTAFEVMDKMLAETSDPIDGIKNFLKLHTEAMLNDPESRGCLIANSTSELAHDKEIQAFLTEHNEKMKAKFVQFLSDSHLSEKAEAIADLLLIHVTGISVMSKFIKDPKRFEASNERFIKSLEA